MAESEDDNRSQKRSHADFKGDDSGTCWHAKKKRKEKKPKGVNRALTALP